MKESKSGDARLRLSAQEDNATLPVYGSGGCVEGTVEMTKTDGVMSVEVKVRSGALYMTFYTILLGFPG